MITVASLRRLVSIKVVIQVERLWHIVSTILKMNVLLEYRCRFCRSIGLGLCPEQAAPVLGSEREIGIP